MHECTGPLNAEWLAIMQQTAEPFTPVDHPTASHASKIAFRLTPPLIAGVLGLQRTGYVVLQGISVVALFFFLARAASRVLHERHDVVLLLIAIAFMFVGNVWVSDVRGIFDGIAFALMAAALATRSGLLLMVLMGAFFTDERALIASPLILLWHVVAVGPTNSSGRWSAVWPCAGAVVLYLAARWWLSTYVGLRIADIPFTAVLSSANLWPFGLWTGLEGLWLLVLAGSLALFIQRRYLMLTMFIASMIAVSFAAFCVIDITRSMAYLFPAVFVGLAIHRGMANVERVRGLLVAAVCLCLVPTYYAEGDRHILLYRSLPARVLIHVCQ